MKAFLKKIERALLWALAAGAAAAQVIEYIINSLPAK